MWDSIKEAFSFGQINPPLIYESSQTVEILQPATAVAPRVKGFVVDENALATLPEEQSIDKQVPLIQTYVVHPGDSLSIIANMFNVSVNTILWSNGLSKGTVLKEGQTLVILPVSGVSHKIVKGDTLAALAKKFSADVDEIKSFNGISSDSDLVIGEVVIIPDGELTPPAPVVAKAKVLTKGGLPGLVTGGYDRDPHGYFIRPVVGGRRTQGIHGFNGVDLANTPGTPIIAAADGVVIVSKSGGWNGGYGSYIVVSHANGMQTLYAHLSVVIATVGQHVEQGETIGKMGATGKATGTHLHFEVRGGKNPF